MRVDATAQFGGSQQAETLGARWLPGAHGAMATYPEITISPHTRRVLPYIIVSERAQDMEPRRRCLICRRDPIADLRPALRVRSVRARSGAGGGYSEEKVAHAAN